MNDPNVVVVAPNVSALLEGAVGCEEGLRDRARGVMLGLAVGNLLGLPMEGWSYREIDRWYPDGVRDIDAGEAHMPMDDDLAQAVDLGEALLEGGDYVGEFGRRLVVWRRENGRGIGITTDRVIGVLEAGHRPPDAARIVYEGHPIAPNGGVMRCAPVALARFREPELLVSDSAATCVVTHYAPTSQWSCIVINAVIALLLKGTEPDLSALMGAASGDGCPDMLGDGVEGRDSVGRVGEHCEWGSRGGGLFVAAGRAEADRAYADCASGGIVGGRYAAGIRGCVAAGGGGGGRYGHERGSCWGGLGSKVWSVGNSGAVAGRGTGAGSD